MKIQIIASIPSLDHGLIIWIYYQSVHNTTDIAHPIEKFDFHIILSVLLSPYITNQVFTLQWIYQYFFGNSTLNSSYVMDKQSFILCFILLRISIFIHNHITNTIEYFLFLIRFDSSSNLKNKKFPFHFFQIFFLFFINHLFLVLIENMDPPPPRHSKHYRPKQLETPSYTGGLNRSVEERIHENRRQHRSHHAGSESRYSSSIL